MDFLMVVWMKTTVTECTQPAPTGVADSNKIALFTSPSVLAEATIRGVNSSDDTTGKSCERREAGLIVLVYDPHAGVFCPSFQRRKLMQRLHR